MIDKAELFLSTLNRSKNTVETYRQALERYFSIAGEELSDEAYENFLPSLRDLSPSTQAIIRSAVMGLYQFSRVGDVANRSRLNKHYLKKNKTNDVTFNKRGIEKVLKFCDTLKGDLLELRDRAFILTLADSGFRISELCSLNRGMIDWDEQQVLVIGKGDKPKVVRLSRRSLGAIRDYLRSRAEMDGSSGKPLISIPLFVQHGNIKKVKRMTPDGMRKSVKMRILEAGVKPETIRIHDFRHYFVTTVVIATGGNLKIAKELARHENIRTTQRYSHYAEDELGHAYDDIFNQR